MEGIVARQRFASTGLVIESRNPLRCDAGVLHGFRPEAAAEAGSRQQRL